MRLSKDDYYMTLAIVVGSKSSCARRHVGAVITDFGKNTVLSIGYNGNARGLPNKCDNPDKKGGCGCLHSEQNAVTHCHVLERNKVLFAQVFPCSNCAKWIIQMGFSSIVYLEPYARSKKECKKMSKAEKEREGVKRNEEKKLKRQFSKKHIKCRQLKSKVIHNVLVDLIKYLNPTQDGNPKDVMKDLMLEISKMKRAA